MLSVICCRSWFLAASIILERSLARFLMDFTFENVIQMDLCCASFGK